MTIPDLDHNIGVTRRLKAVASDGQYILTRMDEAFCQGFVKPLPLHYDKCVFVQDSPIHGRGLFAASDIPANTIVTYHPAHYIFTKGGYYAHNGQSSEPEKVLSEYKRSYSYECVVGQNGERERFVLIGNPNKTDNPSLLGHMVNDACGNVFLKVKATKLRKSSQFISTIKRYYSTLAEKRNCGIDENASGSVACIVTLKDVAKGEELLTGYGILYWIQHQYGPEYHTLYPYLEANINKLNTDEEFGKFLMSLQY
jgi:hypothetical protein